MFNSCPELYNLFSSVISDLELLFGFLCGLLHCEGAVCMHNMGQR